MRSGALNASPTIADDGTIYVASGDRNVYAVAPDGVMKCSYFAGEIPSTSPAIGLDGVLYVGRTGAFLALRPDGSLKWLYGVDGDVDHSAAIGADGTAYIGSTNGKLYAIRVDGTKKWTFTASEPSSLGDPSVGADGVVYVSSGTGAYALDPDGTVKWALPIPSTSAPSPAIGADGTLYFGMWGALLAVGP